MLNTACIAGPAVTKTFTWNEDGRLASHVTSAGTSNFGYTGLGARASSSGAVGAATYLCDGVSVVSPMLKDGTSTFTPGTSLRTGATSTYSHSGLKNAMSQTASSGIVSATKGYDAFGNTVSSSGTWQGPFAYAGGFGYQTDSTGYKLLGHRYYDPDTGRLLSRDPIKDGRNWYAYCEGHPIAHVDCAGTTVYSIDFGGNGVLGIVSGSQGWSIGYDTVNDHWGLSKREGIGVGAGVMWGIGIGGGYNTDARIDGTNGLIKPFTEETTGLSIPWGGIEFGNDAEGNPTGGSISGGIGWGAGAYHEWRWGHTLDITQAIIDGKERVRDFWVRRGRGFVRRTARLCRILF